MASTAGKSPSPILGALGDFRWVRAHVSLFAVGAVLLVCINLLMGSESLWSLTAIGIWAMLLVVHMVILAIARLSVELMADDDEEEIVLLPVKDAVFIEPKADPPASWKTQPPNAEPSEAETPSGPSTATNGEKVSWQIATNAAQAKRDSSGE